VSRHAAGPVLTISLEPNIDFNSRSGMASSSRRRAIELWETAIPVGDLEKLARMVFAFENPPGTEEFSGSQDSIGIVYPGLNRLDYRGKYWPEKITSVHDEKVLRWLEEHIRLVTLGPRKGGFNVLKRKRITAKGAQALARAANGCWEAILKRDLPGFGRFCRESFEAQVRMFPDMVDAGVLAVLKKYRDKAAGWKLSGAGGGGYLVLITNHEVPGGLRIAIRRRGL
jgi:galactokinase/mevalonate kinase-like predicted kinase